MKLALIIVGIVLVTIVLADFVYSRVVLARWAKWEKTVVRDAQGVREHCASYSLGSATGESRTAILLIHGFADSPALYRNYAPLFAEQGYFCKAIRLPGWAVPLEEMKKVQLADWKEAIVAEVSGLRGEYEQVWVVAHSLGAALSLSLAREKKLDVDGLVAITPMVKVADTRSPVLTSEQWFRVANTLLHFSRTVESIFPVDMHDKAMTEPLYRDIFVPRNIYSALFDVMDELEGDAGKITLPTMMILSKDDQIVDSGAAEQFYKRLGANDRKLVIVENSGHVVPLDNDWQVTAEIIDAFIRTETEAGKQ